MKRFRVLRVGVVFLIMCAAMLAAGDRTADLPGREFAARSSDEFCGTKTDTSAYIELAKTQRQRRKYIAQSRRRDFVIPVHFHVIQDDTIGAVDDQTLLEEINIMNVSFRRLGFTFVLASIDRTTNRSWFSNCDADGAGKRMKSALRTGRAGDLNVYTCAPTRFLGRSAFPWEFASSPAEDGVILHYGVMPGGTVADFNTGEVLAHETGHWLGLFHTFQNGCAEPGDDVGDTPAEAGPSFNACPIGLDTCPSAGADPTDNFMDYSGDACWMRFSDDQTARMSSMFAIYREGQ